MSTDPVGTVIIGIYLAEAEYRTVGLDKIAAYAAIAPSTAMRWEKVLR